MPVDLHFICKLRKRWSKAEVPNTFNTGNWAIAEATAEEAVGGHIYLHEKQAAPAWHGGLIIGWRSSPEPDRLIFTYQTTGDDFRLVCEEGWGREKAIISR